MGGSFATGVPRRVGTVPGSTEIRLATYNGETSTRQVFAILRSRRRPGWERTRHGPSAPVIARVRNAGPSPWGNGCWAENTDGSMELTNEEKATFYRDGYVTLRGIVPRDMVDAARHTINHSLGEQGMDKQDLPVLRTTSYCKDIQGSKTITGLVDNSPVLPLVESLLG